jgi:hypothetical protein
MVVLANTAKEAAKKVNDTATSDLDDVTGVDTEVIWHGQVNFVRLEEKDVD